MTTSWLAVAQVLHEHAPAQSGLLALLAPQGLPPNIPPPIPGWIRFIFKLVIREVPADVMTHLWLEDTGKFPVGSSLALREFLRSAGYTFYASYSDEPWKDHLVMSIGEDEVLTAEQDVEDFTPWVTWQALIDAGQG